MNFKNIIANREITTVGEISSFLNTGKDGISTESIPGRVQTYGSNVVPKIPPKSFWRILWNTANDPLLWILVFSATIATIFGLVFEEQRDNREWIEGVAIWITVLVIVSIGTYNDWRQERAFHKLNSRNDEFLVKVIRDGDEQQISTKDLVVGDLVILESGDKVPADGYFWSANAFGIDESALTGESITVRKNEEDPWFRSGSVVVEGNAKMIVVSVGAESEYGRTIALVQTETEKTPLQKKLVRFVKYCAIIAILVSMSVFAAQMIRWGVEDPRPSFSEGPLRFIVFSITILVIGMPEGLPAAVMIVLTYSIKRMIKDDLFVRHLAACETLGSTSMLLSDKTGTLTENKMSVVKGVFGSEMFDHVPPSVSDDILINCAVNSTAFIDDNGVGIGSQTEVAMLRFVNVYSSYEKIRDKHEASDIVPFSSATKMSSVVVDGKKYSKGAPEFIMNTCDIADRERLNAYVHDMASSGLRTIALARDDTLLCILGIKDPVRRSVPTAVKMCESAGIGIVMVTGDNIDTAKHIARDIGMLKFDDVAIEGKEFRSMSKEQKMSIAPKLRILARSSPEDKYELVKLMKELGHVVASSGDGANDAPALKEADVGCSMGSGTDLAKEVSDIVILNDDFDSIVSGVRWGRTIMQNIRAFVMFQVVINIVALTVVSVAVFANGTTPLNVIMLVYVNLAMDTFAAIGIATIPPSQNVMKNKPDPRNQFVITMPMLRAIVPQSLYQIACQLVLFFATPQILDISEKQLSGLMFNTFIFTQIFNFNNMVDSTKIFPLGFSWKSRVSYLCIAGMIGMQVVIMLLLEDVFKFESITTNMWFVSVGLGSGSFVVHVLVSSVYAWLMRD
ncbi:calcium-transporting ATPase, plasma membrane-type [Paramecium bursaria Chlorella virus NE-JV-1]|nr:calcium-transporting ATPase, plasma membrane-type [Paramecium bursaria Chlorella virus NE-JV-1]